MITMKFIPGWDAVLLPTPQPSDKPIQYSLKKPFINDLLARVETSPWANESTIVKKVIEKVMRAFDTADTLYGLFQVMNPKGVSPFVATHDYCLKVESCDRFGRVAMRISPIYHLGLEYPENYKRQHDKDIDHEAIIGLFEIPVVGTLPPGHTSYSYGVDAGVLFESSKIPHNLSMTLEMDEIREGILITIHCNGQTTSTTLSWERIGLHATHTFEVREPQPEMLTQDLS